MPLSVVQFASGNTGTSTSTSVTVSLTATPSLGNLFVVFFQGSGVPTVTAPSGWTSLFATASAHAKLWGFYKVVASGDGTSYTFTSAAAQMASWAFYEVTGQHPTAPINQSSGQLAGASSPALTPSVTPSVSGTLGLSCVGNRTAAIPVTAVSSGWSNDIPGGASTMRLSAASRVLTTDTSMPVSNAFTYAGTMNEPVSFIALIAPATSSTVSASLLFSL